MRGDIYEEEDFIAHTFGFGFCEDISDAQLGSLLKEVEEDLQAKQRRVKGKKTTGKRTLSLRVIVHLQLS